jgi:hypothetical protein
VAQVLSIPPVKGETYFLSTQGRRRNGLKEASCLLLRKDGRIGFEGGCPRDELVPVGFRTASPDGRWLFEKQEVYGIQCNSGHRLIRAMLEIFSICGYRLPLTGFSNLASLSLAIHWLEDDDVLATPVLPPLKPALPVGTRILVYAESGQIAASHPAGNSGIAQITHGVNTPFGWLLDEATELLWLRQVLDAFAAAGVFVAPQLERSLHGLVATVTSTLEWPDLQFLRRSPEACAYDW